MRTVGYTSAALAAAISATLMTTGVAQAKPAVAATDDTVSQSIRHADLDLNSDEGKRIFRSRVRHLVDELCVMDNLTSSSVRKRCKEAVMKAANPHVQQAVGSTGTTARR